MAQRKAKRALAGVLGGMAVTAATARLVAGWRQRSSNYTLPPGRAVITGSSSGIGETFARQLAAAGHDLTLVARREERLRALAGELSAAHGIQADVLVADLSREEDIDRVAGYLAGLEDLGLLINNAGFGTQGNLAGVEVQSQLDMVRVHVLAPLALTRAALPGLIRRGAGAVINVSSIAAFFASAGGANYGATKAYLNTLSEALALELTGTGVKVQALCPGFTFSGFHDTPEYANFDRKQVPAALWMPADEVVRESLSALRGNEVIVVPGRRYRAIVAASSGPLRAPLRRVARRIRQKWRSPRARSQG